MKPSRDAQWREIVSRRRRGLGASLARLALGVVEVPYTLVMRVRNRRYDRGRAEIAHVSVPVISVGNLTLGGTGKTPLVCWIARWLRDRGVRVALLSRGYGAEVGSRNDEALELEQRLPDVPHVQNRDRVAAASTAIEEFATQAIVLDDGFQHRRLARDLDLVLLDAAEPFGYGHVFPRGLLREPIEGLRRADVVLLSRADMVTVAERAALRARVATLAPDAVWAEVVHAPQQWQSAEGVTQPLDALRGVRIAAFCGIGNPAGFRHTLTTCGCEVVALREFPDHHAFTRDDVQSLTTWAAGLDVAAIVCTHKDLVKLQVVSLGALPLWALVIGLTFLAGEADVVESLETLLPLCPPDDDI